MLETVFSIYLCLIQFSDGITYQNMISKAVNIETGSLPAAVQSMITSGPISTGSLIWVRNSLPKPVQMVLSRHTVWTVNDVLSWSISLDLSRFIPFLLRVWINSISRYGWTQDVIDGPLCTALYILWSKSTNVSKNLSCWSNFNFFFLFFGCRKISTTSTVSTGSGTGSYSCPRPHIFVQV